MNSNNKADLAGHVSSELKISHSVYGETFYSFELKVRRNSDTMDKIPCLISERLFDDPTEIFVGALVHIKGKFCSYNKRENESTRLLLYVYVEELVPYSEVTATNKIILDGFLCKPPVLRKTPLGRKISDLMVAVNRPSGKTDYIPCICWGRNAYTASNLTPGAHVRLYGRIQSREYNKKFDGKGIRKTAYEISVSNLENVS